MARRRSSQLTEVELQICQAIWQRGPATVRQVHEAMHGTAAGGYTSTLKMMQVMTDKGLLVRDDGVYPHMFRARVSEETAQASFVEDLVTRVFGGAADKLVQRAISSKRLSRAELTKIRAILENLPEGNKR